MRERIRDKVRNYKLPTHLGIFLEHFNDEWSSRSLPAWSSSSLHLFTSTLLRMREEYVKMTSDQELEIRRTQIVSAGSSGHEPLAHQLSIISSTMSIQIQNPRWHQQHRIICHYKLSSNSLDHLGLLFYFSDLYTLGFVVIGNVVTVELYVE